MTERLIAKLDRLGAEAGIKEMTPEIYRFAQLLNDEKMKQWDAWRAKREWVGLTDEEVELYWDWEDFQIGAGRSTIFEMVRDIEAKLKGRTHEL
jgi:hypothetical protein